MSVRTKDVFILIGWDNAILILALTGTLKNLPNVVLCYQGRLKNSVGHYADAKNWAAASIKHWILRQNLFIKIDFQRF